MQKILFRGMSIVTQDWEYGALIKFKAADGKIHSAIVPEGDDGEHLLNDVYGVEEETVGQWTFLYDKERKMIFSGDILSDDKQKIYTVCQVPGGFALQSTSGYKENVVRFYNLLADTNTYMWVRYSTKIIGNIFENKKLLER